MMTGHPFHLEVERMSCQKAESIWCHRTRKGDGKKVTGMHGIYGINLTLTAFKSANEFAQSQRWFTRSVISL